MAKAKKYTASKVSSKTVTIRPRTTDKYGRTVAIVFVNDSSLNESIVAGGYGWVYEKHCKRSYCDNWFKLEDNARASGIRLWRDPSPEPL